MARISKNRMVKGTRNCRIHEVVDCEFDIFTSEGEKIVQISTFGTDSRVAKGKVSQSIQIDKETAIFLINLFKQEFKI